MGRFEAVSLNHPRVHGEAVEPASGVIGPCGGGVRVDLPICQHLNGAALGQVVGCLANDLRNQVVSLRAAVAVLHQSGCAHRIGSDDEWWVGDDQVEALAGDRLEQGSAAHVNGYLIQCGVETGDCAGAFRQVCRHDSGAVRGQVECLNAAACADIQCAVNGCAVGQCQQRCRCSADAEHVVRSKRPARCGLSQIGEHPPVMVAVRQRGGMWAQVKQRAHRSGG